MANRKIILPQYGTVMKRGVLYYRTRIKDANGKLVAIYAKTPEELYNKETLALEQIENATFHRKTPTVAEYCEKWLLMQSVHVRATTLTDYTSKVRRHIIAELGDKRMGEVSLDDIQLALVSVSKKSASVYKSVVILYKSIFRAAMESRIIDHNPTIYLTTKGGGVPQEERQALTDEQAERLLDAIRDLPPYVFVMIGLYAGLRREEILALQWDSVYLDTDTPYLTVRRAWHTEHNRPVISDELKTKAAERNIPLEIIIQIGDREFWKQFDDMKSYMKLSYQIILDELRKRLPQFVVANAVVHLDEDSPHMHIVGVPVADGYKKGLSKQVSKRKVFTKDVLSRVLQDELREVANKEVNDWFGKQIKEKSKGRNHDLTVAEYKVAQETEHLEQIQEQVHDADIKLFASKIAYKELERSQTKELNEKCSELQSVRQEIASVTDKANETVELLGKINAFVSSFRLFAPTIEEYANHVEADKIIEAGNSFRGILYEIGKLLETFKELIKEGLCWFPRLMRWKTSKGEVAPVFIEKSNGYSYSVYGYINVDTKEYYSKELMQWEIKAGNRTGTVEQMDANVEAMARDLQEILRIGAEQKRLWEVYEGR